MNCRDARRVSVVAVVLVLVAMLVGAYAAQAATIEVTTTEDPTGAGSCPGTPCSLRQAVAAASAGDTIKLAGGEASPAVYTLTQGSQIVIGKSLTIEGNGPAASVIDGSSNRSSGHEVNRIMKVTAGELRIEGVQFTGGLDGEDEAFQGCSPCETIRAGGGGALFNDGASVSLDEVVFKSNGPSSAQPVGGAIGNAGALEMTNVSFLDDDAALGGALFARGGSISADGVTFENDGTAAYDGGAILLYQGGNDSFTNTTVVGGGWPSSFGGGIDNDGATLTLTNDTLSDNIRGSLETDAGSTTVENTILGSGFSDGADFDCVAAGKGNNIGATTAKAITVDLGHNIDQDGACGLDAEGDHSSVDPKLASIADNGGPTRTEALVHGSPAIEGGDDEACPLADQRGVSRPQGEHCDIGAFEAQFIGEPSASTQAASNVTDAEATLHALVDFGGEAGGFHFLWGASPSELVNETAEMGAGVISTGTAEAQQVFGLTPETTYYFKAVADNASGSVPAGDVQSFTTSAGPPEAPVVSNVRVASTTETTATVELTIDPSGADTSYVINYGRSTAYTLHTEPEDIGAGRAAKQLSRTLTGLEPSRAYHFDVLATNSQAPEGVASEDHHFTTKAHSSGGEGGSKGGEEGTKGGEEGMKGGEGGGTKEGESGTKEGEGTPKSGGETSTGPTASTASTSSATGHVLGSSTFQPPGVPLPAPVLGATVNVEVVSGTVLVALPAGASASASLVAPLREAVESVALEPAFASLSKGLHFVPLSEARQIPVGSTLEATAGVARITTATATVGKTQAGDFGAGIFKLLQPRKLKGLTELDIVDNHSAKQVCATGGKNAAVAAKRLSGKVLGRLNSEAHGSFTTHGQYSASTVRGTAWSVANQCDGTLTTVARGEVSVRDFSRRKTITLFAGQHYLAKAPG